MPIAVSGVTVQVLYRASTEVPAYEEMVGRGGFEPPTNGLKVRCSTS